MNILTSVKCIKYNALCGDCTSLSPDEICTLLNFYLNAAYVATREYSTSRHMALLWPLQYQSLWQLWSWRMWSTGHSQPFQIPPVLEEVCGWHLHSTAVRSIKLRPSTFTSILLSRRSSLLLGDRWVSIIPGHPDHLPPGWLHAYKSALQQNMHRLISWL